MKDDFKVNTNEYLNQCNEKDVVSFQSEKLISVSKLKDVILQSFRQSGLNAAMQQISSLSGLESYSWFREGGKCEILRAGSQGWQQGKIKINVSLEFIPDEPDAIESPLDDVRQEFKQNN
ncbi:MAG: KGK domain-containing protein [Patescibacteria group bacterium]